MAVTRSLHKNLAATTRPAHDAFARAPRSPVDVLTLQIFVSLALVAGAVLLFAFSVKERDHEESHRMALFPLDSDEGGPAARTRSPEMSSNPTDTP